MPTIASRLDVTNRIGRALSDPTRSRIQLRLLDEPGHPARLAHELGLMRTNVSNHLACLRDCGIIVAVPEGRWTRYEIADRPLALALEALSTAAGEPTAPGMIDGRRERCSFMNALQFMHACALLDPTSEPARNDFSRRYDMAETETHAEHTVAEHQHAAGCGHETVQHEDHVDFVHDGHKHAEHDGHYDEH